jgi:hypothetical protein
MIKDSSSQHMGTSDLFLKINHISKFQEILKRNTDLASDVYQKVQNIEWK